MTPPPNGRVYRMRSSERFVATTLLVAGVIVTIAMWAAALAGVRNASFTEMMAPFVFAVAAGMFTMRAYRNRIRVSPECIELRGLSGTRVLPADKIKGRRRYFDPGEGDGPSVWHLVLESDDDRFPQLDFEELYRFDAEFYAWFNSLPDLDEADKTKLKTSNFGLV